MKEVRTIPRPLVLTNQWFIVISVLVSWVSKQEWILLLPLVAGIMGLLLKWNPVMKLASLFLHKPKDSYIPEEWEQQQFNQLIAVVCLALSVLGFAAGSTGIGYLFSAMVAAAAFVAILGFCVGCFIRYQWKQFTYRKALKNEK